MPGWLFGAIYFGYSVYQMLNPRQGDNIGHAAHLGGAIFGIVVIAFLQPLLIAENALLLRHHGAAFGIYGVPIVTKNNFFLSLRPF